MPEMTSRKRRFDGHIMAGSITFCAPPASMVGWPTGWLAWKEAALRNCGATAGGRESTGTAPQEMAYGHKERTGL